MYGLYVTVWTLQASVSRSNQRPPPHLAYPGQCQSIQHGSVCCYIVTGLSQSRGVPGGPQVKRQGACLPKWKQRGWLCAAGFCMWRGRGGRSAVSLPVLNATSLIMLPTYCAAGDATAGHPYCLLFVKLLECFPASPALHLLYGLKRVGHAPGLKPLLMKSCRNSVMLIACCSCRMLARSWSSWRQAVAEIADDRIRTQQAAAHLQRRALSLALAMWQEGVAEAVEERVKTHTAGAHLASVTLCRAWDAWASMAQELAQRRAALGAAARVFRLHAMVKAWQAWLGAVARRRDKAAQVHWALQLSQGRTLAAAWLAWRDSTEKAARNQDMLRTADAFRRSQARPNHQTDGILLLLNCFGLPGFIASCCHREGDLMNPLYLNLNSCVDGCRPSGRHGCRGEQGQKQAPASAQRSAQQQCTASVACW